MNKGIHNIKVIAKDKDGDMVEGTLTGIGAGKYTGVTLKNGDVVAVVKNSVELIK